MAALERVNVLLQSGQYEQVGHFLDEAELQSLEVNVLQSWPHALHMLGHIYAGDLTDARFLYKRLPQAVKDSQPELQAVFKLLQLLWNKQYIAVWQALHGYQWSQPVLPVIDALALKLRQQMLDLVEMSYSTVAVAKFASLCGMSEQEAASYCLQKGWQQDATGVFTVVHQKPSAAPQDGLVSLEQLSTYMLHLESS